MSISKAQFGEQMERLQVAYGDKFGNTERVDAYWHSLQRFDYESIRKAVTFVIGENTMPPPLSKVITAIELYRPSRQSSPYEDHEAKRARYPECSLCRRDGAISTWVKEGYPYEVLFKCSCPAGELFKARAQVWNPSIHSKEYTLENPRGKGMKEANPKSVFPTLPYNPAVRQNSESDQLPSLAAGKSATFVDVGF